MWLSFGRSVGEQNEQVLVPQERFHQLAHTAQSQTVAVPARGKMIQAARCSPFLSQKSFKTQHRVTRAGCKPFGHARRDAAGGGAFGKKIALNGDALPDSAGAGSFEASSIRCGEAPRGSSLAEKDTAVIAAPVRARRAAVNREADVLGLLMDEHTEIADLLCQAQEHSDAVRCMRGRRRRGFALGLLGSPARKTLRVGAHGLARHSLAAGEPEMAAEVIAGAAALLDTREARGRLRPAALNSRDHSASRSFERSWARSALDTYAVLAGDRGAADDRSIGADDLDRQELGEQRRLIR